MDADENTIAYIKCDEHGLDRPSYIVCKHVCDGAAVVLVQKPEAGGVVLCAACYATDPANLFTDEAIDRGDFKAVCDRCVEQRLLPGAGRTN